MKNEEEIRFCDCCGTEIDGDRHEKFEGQIYCPSCFEEDTVCCQHCGVRILWDSNAGDEDTPLCSGCYDDYYVSCSDCGRVIHQNDAYYLSYNDDDAYCEHCYNENDNNSIHSYCYKPSPFFYGEGKRFFGVELEIDDGGKDCGNADCLLNAANRYDETIYIKTDGSLDDGLEIVTHPMTLDYHKNQMLWQEIVDTAISLGYRSHKTKTCGLHIHVNRTAFGDTDELQNEAVSRVLYFVEHHWNELLKFSRRTEYQMNRWDARYGYKNSPKEILDHAKKSGNGRYYCVNITNFSTVEFRMFRGTLKLNTLIATLELVDKICELAISRTDDELAKMSWTDFVMSLDKDGCKELITYLKERQLYVNAPVETKEDV